MITISNKLSFDNNESLSFNNIKVGGVLSFDDKQLEFKKDGRVFYNGEQIYYKCQGDDVSCNNCNDSTCYNCAGKCNNCDACNRQCNSCTACNTCWNCVKCNERCNACTVCRGCYNTCVDCVNCQKICNDCRYCVGCNGCQGYSCSERTGCGVGSVPSTCDIWCHDCNACNGGCYNSKVNAGCQDCISSCFFFDGAIGDCPEMYYYAYDPNYCKLLVQTR